MADSADLHSESSEASASSDDEEVEESQDQREIIDSSNAIYDFFDGIRWDDFEYETQLQSDPGLSAGAAASIRNETCKESVDKLNPEYQDIMKEFAEVETFLISMDSLVVELASYDCLSWALGGTVAPVVEMAESFLSNLRAKGGVFRLIWFSDLQSVFKLSPSLNLIRTVVKKYFESTDYPFEVFSNPLDPFYRQQVKELCPSFLMTATNGHKLLPVENTQLQECLSSLLLVTLLRDSTSVVLFPGMTTGLASIRAFVLDPIQSRKVFHSYGHHISNAAQSAWKAIRLVGSHLSSYALTSIGDVGTECTSISKFYSRLIQELRRHPGCFISDSTAQSLLLYACLLESLSTSKMNQTVPLPPLGSGECSAQILENFELIQSTVSYLLIQESSSDLCVMDIFNGPLLFSVAVFCDRKLSKGEMNIVPECALKYFQEACLELDLETSVIWSKAVKKSTLLQKPEVTSPVKLKIQRINHPVLSAFAGSLNDMVATPTCEESALPGPFDSNSEDKFWDTSKSLETELTDPKSRNEKDRKRVLRARQKYIEWVKFYGETLEGRDSHLVVDFSVALPGTSFNSDRSKTVQSPRSASPRSGKSRSASKTNKKDEIIQRNLLTKKTETLSKLRAALSNRQKTVLELQSLLANPKFSSDECRAMIIYQSFILYKSQHEMNATECLEKGDILLVNLVKTCRQLNNPAISKCLTDEQKSAVSEVWNKISYTDGLEQKTIKANLPDFLLHNGSLIDVQLNPTKDARVSGFIPDAWQREMLDVVDGEESALIVAPTSAGKTFISYYCMEKVLRAGDDGVVVYVAPTKALVNQVAATVYARFRNKNFRKPGRTLFGVFLKEYHHNVLASQILITVPECLETLLLRSGNESWVRRLKYAILDEVHCIGGGIGDVKGAEVLEHALLFIPCPFMALSATIGNPQILQKWLEKVENKKRAKNVRLICHEERNSELEINLFNLTHNSSSTDSPVSIFHPFVVFTPEKLRTSGFPQDLHLTAAQIFQLYQTVSKTEPKLRETLAPSTVFENCSVSNWLNRSDLRSYEEKLKSLFFDSTEFRTSSAFKETILANLTESTAPELSFRSIARDFEVLSLSKMSDLVQQLKKQDMLPALCFSDNRKLCVIFAMRVYKLLCRQEKEFLSKPSSKATLLRFQKDSEKHSKTKAFEEKVKKRITEKKKEELTKQAMFIGDNPLNLRSTSYFGSQLDEFTLAKPKADSDLLEKVIDRLYERDSGKQLNSFAHMLRRGIGCHHPGMSTVKRQAVEILFRSGHLGIVFSTSTLALGIHMPCRTVIFATDSPDLTPLQFRQMSGRAGRRGFDEKGSVIFLGLPKTKIARLLTATLPKLRGNVPFTPPFVLRLLKLTHDKKADAFDVQRVIGLLENPLVAEENCSLAEYDAKMEYFKFYFLYSVYFLEHCGFINTEGKPTGLATLIDALPNRGPGTIILARLLSSGILRKYLQILNDSTTQKEAIIIILSHLFANEAIFSCAAESVSKLPPLPEHFAESIDRHNQEAIALLSFLSRILNSKSAESHRPSDYEDEGNAVSAEFAQKVTELEAHLDSNQKLQDGSFFTLVGVSEPIDILRTYFAIPFRTEVVYDEELIPGKTFPKTDYRGRSYELNSYALNFFRNGNFKLLLSQNGLTEGKAYSLLHDFDKLLEVIANGLTTMSAEDGDPLVMKFRDTYSTFHNHFLKLNRKTKN